MKDKVASRGQLNRVSPSVLDMLKENWRFIARVERVGDFIITIVAFLAAYYGRDLLILTNSHLGWDFQFGGPSLAPIKDYFIVLVAALTSSSLYLSVSGAYGSMRLSSPFQLFRIFVFCSLLVFVTLAASLFLLKIDLSRSFIVLFCCLMAVFLTLERYAVLWLLRFLRRRGFNYRNVMICGAGEQAVRLSSQIAARPELGIRIRCFGDLREPFSGQHSLVARFRQDVRQLGGIRCGKIHTGVEEVIHALRDYALDEVIFTDIAEVMTEVEEVILSCTEQGVRTTLAADLFSIGMVKSGLSYFGDMPLIHFQTPPGDRWELSVKRLIDVVLSGALLLVLSPLFVIIAMLVRFSSPGSVLFRQKRVGLNGRQFTMFKFRSMYEGAESQLPLLLEQNEMIGPVFKMESDPRITRAGRFLRKHSLDELPQLWNVFIGDMSLVGPRPPVPGEVSGYERHYRRRLSMRPGLTCTWQVSGRNIISDFDSWVKLDLEYIDNWSLGLDFRLLLRTIPAVVLGDGAR